MFTNGGNWQIYAGGHQDFFGFLDIDDDAVLFTPVHKVLVLSGLGIIILSDELNNRLVVRTPINFKEIKGTTFDLWEQTIDCVRELDWVTARSICWFQEFKIPQTFIEK